GVLRPTAGINRKEQRKARAEFIRAGLRYAVRVVGDRRLVDIEARWVVCQVADVEYVEQGEAEHDRDYANPGKQWPRFGRRGCRLVNLIGIGHRRFRREYISDRL